MTPMMHERVRNMFGDAGLTDGFTVQKLLYDDHGDPSTAVMVFRPNGGSSIRNALGSDYYVWSMLSARRTNAAMRLVQFSALLIMSVPTPWLMSASAISRIWAQFPRRCLQKKGE